MPPTKTYAKPGLSSTDLVARLQSNGLSVPVVADAISALERIGYYRLLIYMRPLQDSATKRFLTGVSFDDVLELYEFDRQLRLLCMDAIERVEVALRSAITQKLAVPHGPHFYVDSVHYATGAGRSEFLQIARDAKYLALTHYRNTYAKPKDAPIWAVLEAVTFGVTSRLFADLSVANRRAVAAAFGYDEKVLVSWFRTLNVLRNMCAHHNRLWNFTFLAYQPIKAKSLTSVFAAQTTFHARAVVLVALLNQIGHSADWKARLISLVDGYPGKIPPSEMGFPASWHTDPFWL